MKVPARLRPLVEDGLIDEVLSQLMSGKEAQVFVVLCGDVHRCAKVYKEASKRSFKQAVQYQEGRRVKNSRSARAIGKRSRYGQKEQEQAWLTAEVDALRRLGAADVRVPSTHGFVDGVLLMDMICDAEGYPAPRLNDITLTSEEALKHHDYIISEVVKMLCAGIIHGDLSEFNILMSADGPVIIDLPQAVNASGNNSAAGMLLRDVENMANYFGNFAPELRGTHYGLEMWSLYEKGNLHPDSKLTGKFEGKLESADVEEVLRIIEDAREQAQLEIERRQAALED